ncbi:bifunctional diaminohydroxyphosphoribosylaminopyrimidine deaminase/5-amino-6-(5-phosphoribosylamino)uracil reductase RibD [uncultured Varibaculum sp.]|uniref:bifunctional diaminohydroxyphosphoribosylaminopyrimidine deaminase/5-amino-6-(5-phosphoribosylamino)uracil reductase RibD n=1 Tax=uncultured Varibaculum sp. TaxID=413896 RepID=UPI0027D93F2A|nr:bifunctional diaminohydroxyphosphoribosylaminopyrimidine deaminase/5-amino-6-(5-phosphoribosylamino)uracil reductase RibD [uncultured Varibaculum sp.]
MALSMPSKAALTHGLAAASKAALQGPRTGGNPQVGCAILSPAGRILSMGYHRGAGSAHAEVDALTNLKEDTGSAPLTAVVTLEPCNHTGKTPPCSRALIEAGIKNVIWAVDDPNPRASGGGEYLRSQGINAMPASEAGIDENVLAKAREVSAHWVQATRRGRPWTIAKVAQTLDGYCAAKDGSSQWITNRLSRAYAHRIRSSVDVIIAGTGTVLADNPQLSARLADGRDLPHQPRPLVVGKRDIPTDYYLAGKAEPARTHDLKAVLESCYQRGEIFALLEGGPTLVTAALQTDLVDELHIYLAPRLLGAGHKGIGDLGISALTSSLDFQLQQVKELGGDVFLALIKEGASCLPD